MRVCVPCVPSVPRPEAPCSPHTRHTHTRTRHTHTRPPLSTGLLGFPPKDLQYRFLSQFRPAFYIRQRDYSKVRACVHVCACVRVCGRQVHNAPPARADVSMGAVCCAHGGLTAHNPLTQVMLRQDSGEYACVAEDATRYTLGQAKEEMMAAMGLDTEAPASAMAFLRRGYKARARVP